MRKLDHIGIYVRSIDDASAIYERLGFPVERVMQFNAGAGRVVPIAFIPVGDGVDLELIEAPGALDAGFEPLHHICFEVPDIAA
ncbi:MAG: VOC family protein, partial [Dehalococcoidia bacterium]